MLRSITSIVGKTCLRLLFALWFLCLAAPHLHGEDAITNPVSYERLRQKTMIEVRQKLAPLLNQYCGEACQIIDVEVSINETIPEVSDLGFEGVADGDSKTSFYAERVTANIQIDRRMTQVNREKLLVILNNHLKHFGVATQINWVPVELPHVGSSANLGQILTSKIKNSVEDAVVKVIQKYCPNTCLLSDVSVDGSLINPDEASGIDARELVRSEGDHMVFHLSNVNVALSMDQKLGEGERQNILALMKARTKFVRPLNFEVEVSSFPESYNERVERLNAESGDPYGLDKLRQMLTMFRELAGTKEIISKSSSELESSKEESARESALSSSQNTGDWILYGAGALLALLILGFVFVRFAQANRDAKLLMHAMPNMAKNDDHKNRGEAGEAASNPAGAQAGHLQGADLKLRLQHKGLKDELTQAFLDSPKVAKETFSRLLQEEGVEEAAKYVHIFGKMIIFELLSDTSLQRNLYELSEYYHKSNFNFSLADEYRLLIALKTKVTANEIRVLASQTIDQFDFLLKLDAGQLFSLVQDESPQVQSIVLTQIAPARRRAVFEMFQGQGKVKLMNELCRADAIPKEYLYNVAMALSKKVLSKPEFDTQSLRSSDIILELLEKSSIKEQKGLMGNLSTTNPDAARLIKLKLVTVHMLPYMKDGHLLELVLGLEREDLLLFLAGCPDNIQRLLISHAPQELAQSWVEDLQQVAGVDEGKYRIVEMMILGKIRGLAAIGAINLLEINELIFADNSEGKGKNAPTILTNQNLVA